MATPEGRFKSKFIKNLEETFPDCIVTKLEADFKAGIPDILIVRGKRWATLEAKASKADVTKPRQNKDAQDYYVGKMNKMSFSSYVYPENEQEVLNELKVFLYKS